MDQLNKEKLKKIGQFAFILLLLFNVYTFFAKDKPLDIPPPPVTIQKPVLIKMTEYITQTGNAVAFNSVDLVARVEGYLDEINFVDGSLVEKGTNLFVIEPEPYLAKLNEAKASLDAQKAVYAYDKSEYERQKRMYSQNATSLNNVEKWFAKSQESAAEVAKAKENLDIASINYSYTHVDAPFNGRIGRHLVDTGNLVGNASATNLATLEQIDPIYVYFNLNELDIIPLRVAAKAQGINDNNLKNIPVYVGLQNESDFKYQGQLDFVNTGLDASTGTLEFRALLPNKNHAILPGFYVQVRMALNSPTPKTAIPDVAIQYDQIGAYVLTVNQENIVVLKRVTLGSIEKEQRAILKGLTQTDLVIVNGIQNATPGNKVNPQSETKI